MRFAPAAALFVLLISGATLAAADSPTKAHRAAAVPTKAPAKVLTTKTLAKAVKPQAKPTAAKRVAVIAAPAVSLAPAAAPAAGTQLITYSGTVLGPNELVLPGACVFVAGDRSRMAVTNAQGEFALTLPAIQTGSLQVSYAGLTESQLPIATSNNTAMFVTLNKK